MFAVRIFTRLSAEYFFAIFYGNLLTFICRTPLIPPYSFTYNMEKGYYDVDNPEKRKKFFDGKLIYLDDSIWWNKKK